MEFQTALFYFCILTGLILVVVLTKMILKNSFSKAFGVVLGLLGTQAVIHGFLLPVFTARFLYFPDVLVLFLILWLPCLAVVWQTLRRRKQSNVDQVKNARGSYLVASGAALLLVTGWATASYFSNNQTPIEVDVPATEISGAKGTSVWFQLEVNKLFPWGGRNEFSCPATDEHVKKGNPSDFAVRVKYLPRKWGISYLLSCSPHDKFPTSSQ